jgi:hypothetical protein
MPTTLQLPADDDGGFDIAAAPVACENKFHR